MNKRFPFPYLPLSMESDWNTFSMQKMPPPNPPADNFFCPFSTTIHLYNFSGSLHDYCQWETFNASCSHGDVVVMTSARFGRMRMGSCVKQSYDTVGCAADVMKYSDSRCSGRRSCTIKVPDIPSQGIRPCPDDLTSYFEASYTCIPGNHFRVLFTPVIY